MRTSAVFLCALLFAGDVLFLVGASMVCDATTQARGRAGGEVLGYLVCVGLVLWRMRRLHGFLEMAEFARRFRRTGLSVEGGVGPESKSLTRFAVEETRPAVTVAAYALLAAYLTWVPAYGGQLTALAGGRALNTLVVALSWNTASAWLLHRAALLGGGKAALRRANASMRPPRRIRRFQRQRANRAVGVANDVVLVHPDDSDDSSVLLERTLPPRRRPPPPLPPHPPPGPLTTGSDEESENESVFGGMPTVRRNHIQQAFREPV